MDKKSQLINEIIDLNHYLNQMYLYHPDNPDGINVVDESIKIKEVIASLTAQIEELDSISKS
jgi:hypothetical protein|tara:strand:+ start:1070 stop:1255 length:186 start_codon:yes stop_codon:yes gene_type:complete